MQATWRADGEHGVVLDMKAPFYCAPFGPMAYFARPEKNCKLVIPCKGTWAPLRSSMATPTPFPLARGPTTLFLLAVLLVRDAAPLVVTVTHAAGRMGVSVVGQLREIGQLSGEDEELGIRAVVRSEAEASRLKLDLCGAVLRNGELRPLLDLKDDLGIDLFIVEDDAHEQNGLATAFAGADVAVLLSAAHADFSPAAGGVGPPKSASLLPTSLLPTSLAASATGVNVRVPPLSGAAAARRLGAEVCAWCVKCACSVHAVCIPMTGVLRH